MSSGGRSWSTAPRESLGAGWSETETRAASAVPTLSHLGRQNVSVATTQPPSDYMKVLYSALEAGAGAQIWLQVPLLPSRYLYIQYCVRYTYSLQVATAASLFILISSPPHCTCVAHSGGRPGGHPDEVRSLPLR